jgi:hypothetical protein
MPDGRGWAGNGEVAPHKAWAADQVDNSMMLVNEQWINGGSILGGRRFEQVRPNALRDDILSSVRSDKNF